MAQLPGAGEAFYLHEMSGQLLTQLKGMPEK